MTTNTTKTTTEREQFSPELLKTHQKTESQGFFPIRRRSNILEKLSRIATVFIGLPLVLSGALLLKPNAALAGGGFAQSCTDLKMYHNAHGWLFAHCPRSDGRINYSARINLNNHIANHNGELVWQQNGNYVASCGRVHVNPSENEEKLDGTVLYTHCRIGGGYQDHATGIDLNRRILNQDGNLVYGGE